MNPDRNARLIRRIRGLTAFFIAGLFLSGLTAIPLETEVTWLVRITGAREHLQTGVAGAIGPSWAFWLCRVEEALKETNLRHPFVAYGADWLAFGHFMIALAFVGAWRDPVRNRWLFDFGLIACALVIPYAIAFGAARGIPFGWRLVDCSFGVLGAVPLWICRRAARELDSQ